MREMSMRLLVERTGEDVATWNRRIAREGFRDEKSLRAWLSDRGVTGYAQSMLVMERFGYPDFMLASADDLVDGQFADRLPLRPIYETLIQAAAALGEVVIQTRKTYVSLVTPRRTFARIQPTTITRVDLALRLQGHKPGPLCNAQDFTKVHRFRLASRRWGTSMARFWAGFRKRTNRTSRSRAGGIRFAGTISPKASGR